MNDAAPSPDRYTAVAKLLHWSIALMIVLQLIIGWTMPEVHRGTLPEGKIAWHLGIGSIIVLLVALRVIWRMTHAPLPAAGDSGWSHRLAQANHLLLYLLMIVVPVLGWANASARHWTVGVGWFELPAIMTAGAKIGPLVGDIHGWLAEVLAVLAGLHVLAGAYHHFVRRDGTLRRMW